jgi:NAD+ kinase
MRDPRGASAASGAIKHGSRAPLSWTNERADTFFVCERVRKAGACNARSARSERSERSNQALNMLWQVTEASAPKSGPPSVNSDSTRRVAVLTHMGRPAAIAAATRLVEGLSAAGIVSALPGGDLAALGPRLSHAVVPLSKPVRLGDGIELMVVLGGDGTILRGAEWVLASEIPLLGVNLGHVGFLAEAESSEIDSIVARVVERSYTVEERFTIDITLRDSKTLKPSWSSYAINEVTIEKAARERMLEVLVEIDGRPLSRWACDGMLVSTPTGSTAYAFSAGGPVVWPGVEALLVVPLSAHALFARPLVLSPTSTVVVEVLDVSRTHGIVSCDGRRSAELLAGMEIEVTRGKQRLRLARLSQAPFTDRLVNKFQLSVEGWRGSANPAITMIDAPA